MSDEAAARLRPSDPEPAQPGPDRSRELAWLFWDDSRLASLTTEELAAEIEELRRSGRTRRLRELARRFVERGRGRDTIRLFRPAEIRAVLDEIERSPRALGFVDPVRIRMYHRYLRDLEDAP